VAGDGAAGGSPAGFDSGLRLGGGALAPEVTAGALLGLLAPEMVEAEGFTAGCGFTAAVGVSKPHFIARSSSGSPSFLNFAAIASALAFSLRV
ncbi:hypothetical protein ABTA35_19700, partial [Acinetobacter baumannii]